MRESGPRVLLVAVFWQKERAVREIFFWGASEGFIGARAGGGTSERGYSFS